MIKEVHHRTASRGVYRRGKATAFPLFLFLSCPSPAGGDCDAADTVESHGDNGSCDCAIFCASNWAGNVKRQRPRWKGATSVSGTASGPTCTCVEATHWCSLHGTFSTGCRTSCRHAGKPIPTAICSIPTTTMTTTTLSTTTTVTTTTSTTTTTTTTTTSTTTTTTTTTSITTTTIATITTINTIATTATTLASVARTITSRTTAPMPAVTTVAVITAATTTQKEFVAKEVNPLKTTSAASDDGGPPPPTTGATPEPTAFNSSVANAINQAAGNNNKTSAGKSVGIAIAVIILLAVIAFVLHRKYSNSKGLDEARHVQAEYAERENSRNTMSMESNPLARTQSNVATHETWRSAETRNRADTDRNWPAMPAAAAAVEDLTVTTAVYVNQAFEAPSAISSSNMVHLRAGRRQNKLAENPTSSRNSAEMSVYVEKNPNQPIKCDAAKTYAAPVYSEAQDGAVQLYENDFPRPAAATAAGKQQNYEDFNLIIGGVDMEAGAEAGGGGAGAREAAGVGDAGNGAHFYENHVPGYPSAVYAVPEVPTEYNSDYQIPDALAVEGVNLDYADLNNHQSLYDSSV